MIRRLFLQRIAEGVIGLAGVVIGLQWVEWGLTDNTGAEAAARTFNQAIEKQELGWNNLVQARKVATEDDWLGAGELYSDAHVRYYQAGNLYANAAQTAADANCDALVNAARTYEDYCEHMENACSAWEQATDARAQGNIGKARDHRKRGNEARDTAVNTVADRKPPKRDTSSPRC